MKLIYTSILCLLVVCLFTACSSDKKPAAETSPPLEKEAPAERAAPAPDADVVSYEKQLASGNMHFLVTTTGEGSMRHLAIQLERAGQPSSRIDEEVEGTVTNSVLTDLNGNNKPELLVFLNGSGTGSYGRIYGYEFESQYWGPLQMPDLTAQQLQGYLGHDEFQVADGRLVRTFPVYQDTDANCCPTGGKRTLFYTLNNALQFVVERVE
ncbi:hypothetical protein [Pontibacter liquoris]|uniref:hypothetical protein n=1 Tax=Pontibacter liquoris TaxID=2905677 RepID=UPI001FA77E2A|nr:hypothetical protein [Pontibacter liquoris]